MAGFHVTFYDYLRRNLCESDTGNLAVGQTREIKIPKGTYRVRVYMAIWAGVKKTIDFYADESVVNEGSRIELTSTRTSLHPEFDFKFNNGWFDGAHIPISKGATIKFDNHFRGDYDFFMDFKATFYNPYNNKLGEKIIELPYGQVAESETFEVPDGTNRIEINVTKGFTIIDSATFRYRPVKDSKDDVITITLGNRGSWEAMRFNYPECWQKI